MDNIGAILRDNGYTFADVVSVTVYLSDMKHYQEMNAAYRAYFPDGKFPARACVGGLQLALGAEMEISAIAHK
jgi:2-iminobutanoate/2-iminopropanoate deaminase